MKEILEKRFQNKDDGENKGKVKEKRRKLSKTFASPS